MKSSAVVILNWNGQKNLEQFLPFVIAYTPTNQADIIIIDNGSTDTSLMFLQKCYPSLLVYSLDQNYGFAEGYNRVLSILNYEYVVLLNSDVEVRKDWFCSAIYYLNNNPEVSALQPKILSFYNRSFFEYAGASGGFLDKYGYPFCRGRIFSTIEQDIGQYDDLVQVFWASGACLFIRLNDFKQVGGFDPAFFAYQEEIDLCWKLNLKGKKIVCFPFSSVYHVGGNKFHKDYQKIYLNFRNNLLTLYKNLTKNQYNKIRKIRFFLDYLAAFHYILKGQWMNAFAILCARVDFKKMKKKYHNFSQFEVKLQPSILFCRSILCYYYFYKKRKWSNFL